MTPEYCIYGYAYFKYTETLLCIGLRPIGFPEKDRRERDIDVLLNRFVEDVLGTIEAKGDGDQINRLNEIPVDKIPDR
ncbi:unnamed protein product [Parnassius apollo]|uniref:(apollo) hypothetical protein n=1 Tax=Parnassius apollo TaxID=110799 RepID=A0A8S3X9V3_PARAO|nr:unnamed protein product [Parnassius apollo]